MPPDVRKAYGFPEGFDYALASRLSLEAQKN